MKSMEADVERMIQDRLHKLEIKHSGAQQGEVA